MRGKNIFFTSIFSQEKICNRKNHLKATKLVIKDTLNKYQEINKK